MFAPFWSDLYISKGTLNGLVRYAVVYGVRRKKYLERHRNITTNIRDDE